MAAEFSLPARWRQAVCNSLGKKAAKYTTDLMCDIISVDRGLKPMFLVDYGGFVGSEMTAFVQELLRSGLVERKLAVLTVESDVFVLNADASVAHLEAVQSDSSKFVVDVTFSSPEPRAATEDCTQTVRDCALDVAKYIAAMRESSALQGNITPEKSWNISTLFGLLVGYPVLYWYDPTQEGTCLSMVPLAVYNVYVCLEKNSGTALKEKSSICECSEEKSHHKHKLYSFSIPKALQQDFGKQTDCWFKKVRELFALQGVFCCVEMKCIEMTLPTVAL